MPLQSTVSRSSIRLRVSAIITVLLFGLGPAWLFEQESEAKEAEKPRTEKPSTEKSVAEKSDVESNEQVASEDSAVESDHRPLDEQLERTSEGKIRFNFQGQPWLEVLQWLAKSSKMTLDWQELPENKLNLSTQSSYTLDEARDLLNMHLAARGFTLLRRGEVLALVKLENLNPALVPRVDAEELASRDRHEIVRVSFPLDWLVAEDAVKEFEPMKSPFGKLTPMRATNRLEALDTVENLRQIHELLRREQSAHGEERLVVEFKLKHVRAEDILDKLNTLVGAHTNLLRPRDRARMQFERMRRGRDSDRNRNENNRQPQQQEAEVHLVINEHENSILANAPPDKLAVVRQAVQALDVPSAANSRFSDAVTRMKIYRTKSIDPEAMSDLIEDLVEMGKLAKNTQVQEDDDSNTLIVYASPADHLAIANLVSQIDDDGRDVRIITLRQLAPDYALQAIQRLLKGEENSGRSRWRRRGDSNDDQFRIEADLERGRLLLWASDEEFDQVQALLAKLGEGGQSSPARGNVRVLSVPAGASQQALENLKRIWPNLRTNPLRIEGLDNAPVQESARQPTPRRSARAQTPPADRTAESGADDGANTRGFQRRIGIAPAVTFAVASLAGEDDDAEPIERTDSQQPTAARDSSNPASRELKPPADKQIQADQTTDNEAPSINITEGPGGQLIITSQDVEALDAVESLIQQIMPPKADYEVFRLEHASPFSIQLTLEQILGIDQQPYGRSGGLPASVAPQLRFVSDIDTGTLLVQGATAEQLQKIDELIELYDQPESLEAEQQRKTEIYEVKYSHALAVAEVVKEVYRDLLSSNDKTFTRERKEGDGSSRDLGYGVNYGSRIPQFKGLLSIGVEEKSNTLVVSAPAFLMEDVMGLIREVDERAASHKVRVVQLNGVGPEALRGVLSQIPGVTTSAARAGRTRTGAASTGVGAAPGSASTTAVIQGRSSTISRGDARERGRSSRERGSSGGDRSSRAVIRSGGRD